MHERNGDLAAALARRGWTHRDLAERLGTPATAPGSVSEWVRGIARPSELKQRAIEALFPGEVTPLSWLTEAERLTVLAIASVTPGPEGSPR